MIDTCRQLLDTYADVAAPAGGHRGGREVRRRLAAAGRRPPMRSRDGKMGLDIGPGSVIRFKALLTNAATIFWNGPMGVFEFPAFAAGTKGVGEVIARATAKGAVHRGRRRRLRCGGARAGPARGRLLAHLDRRWRVAGILEGKILPGLKVLGSAT